MLDHLRPMPEISSAHINVFVERYNQLLATARSLVNNDQGQAMDLVHDALIEFVRHRPDLHNIKNLDGYLRTLMRNLFKSQRQRVSVHSAWELSIENYDIVERRVPEAADRNCNPHLLLQMQDVLRVICEYACYCKERVKLGSVLILRFFHGYHTSEIAQIMGVTAGAVSHHLKLAQAEICLYLNDPRHFNLSNGIPAGVRGRFRLNYGCLVDDLVDELRQAIFLSSSSPKRTLHFNLHKLYGGQRQEEIDCKTLAHIVSCASCLDAVSSFLGLELLSVRYPPDELSRRIIDKKTSLRAEAGQEAVTRRPMLSSLQVSYGD